jgi:cell division protease FtsH
MPAKLGCLLDREFLGKRREMLLLHLRRLNRREKRVIEFIDLMHVSTHGFGEEGLKPNNSDEFRRGAALHEAGHAAMAILDSHGKNMPEYCSIVPGTNFSGIVAESINYHQSLEDRTTYASFRHRIRIGLAGRAAEELAFGPENISNGSAGDLESAWKIAAKAFATWGFAPKMTSPESSASNLAVIVGKPSASEEAYLEGLTRQFLSDEYSIVLKQLAEQRPLLDAIADRLMWDPVVDQSDLLALSQHHLKL